MEVNHIEVELSLILLILFIGSIIQGVSGFGLGLISMSFLPLIMPLKDSTLLVLVSTALISSSIVIKYRKSIRWKDIIFILFFAMVGRVCSFFLLNEFGELIIMKKILGVVLICLVFFLLRPNLMNHKKTFLQTKTFTGFIGFVGGIIGGLFAVGGPIFVLYLLYRFPLKVEYNTNLQCVFLLTNLFTIILHLFNGDFHVDLGLYVLACIFPVIFGVQLGLYWFEKLPSHLIKKMAAYIVLLAGINLIVFS